MLNAFISMFKDDVVPKQPPRLPKKKLVNKPTDNLFADMVEPTADTIANSPMFWNINTCTSSSIAYGGKPDNFSEHVGGYTDNNAITIRFCKELLYKSFRQKQDYQRQRMALDCKAKLEQDIFEARQKKEFDEFVVSISKLDYWTLLDACSQALKESDKLEVERQALKERARAIEVEPALE